LARVLVAEDDALTRRFIRETLEFAGHDVATASNGSAAIANVDSAGCFDAVITDFASITKVNLRALPFSNRSLYFEVSSSVYQG